MSYPFRFSTLRLSTLAVAMIIAGCTTGPEYKRPEIALPASISAIPKASEGAAPVVSNQIWWKHFKDEALDKLMDEALKNNLDLVVAAARVSESRSLLGLAASDQVPSVYAAASRTRNHNSSVSGNTGPGQPLNTLNNRVTLNASFEIDFWGQYRRASEAARADLLAVQANRDSLKLSLTAQVAQAYFALQSLDARLGTSNVAIKRGEEALAMQKKRFDAGVISSYEYQQREAELDEGKAQVPALVLARNKAHRALAALLGRSPGDVMAPQVKFVRADDTSLVTAAPAGIGSEVLLSRPDIVEAEQRLIAANARIGVARSAYFPAITLTGTYGGESSALSKLFSGPAGVWSFAGGLTQPLWGAGRVTRQVEISEARKEQAVAQYRQAITNAFRDTQDAIEAQKSARESYNLEERRVASLEKSWKLAKQRYENGLASQLDVIDNERGLLNAELARIEAGRALRAAVADFFKAIGGNLGETK